MKRSVSFVVLLVMVFSLVLTPMMAYADGVTDYDKAAALVDKANQDIEKEVMKAQRDVNTYMQVNLEYKVSERIEYLIKVTEEISHKTMDMAKKYGVDVVCEYVEVVIGNITVVIDPLRIVGV